MPSLTTICNVFDAAVQNADITSRDLEQVAAQLKQHGHSEVTVFAEIQLRVRASNTDLFRSIQRHPFRVIVDTQENDLRAIAKNEESWEAAWERAIAPIKRPALKFMKRDVWDIGATLLEDNYTFQAAMVLLASEMVGPYAARVAIFLGYPVGLVQVIAVRLREAGIWEEDEVRCERWFDPENGGLALLLDLMVAEGKLIRRWSERDKQLVYRQPDITNISNFAV